ncbi:MAG: ABC transporter ATP-binding protein [Thermodesulfobacteriota bacterium]
MTKLLEVRDLVVNFALRFGDLTALNGISFELDKGERLGLVGESGAGKSVAGFSIINLISKPGYIARGEVLFEGEKINEYSPEKIRNIRGNRISMIFQDPMMTLNPVLTIGTQMTETLLTHRPGMPMKKVEEIVMDKLSRVYIPSPEKRLGQYPHEFSGGMRQRIVIAISLLTEPALIIADEPTTALDVTIQAEIMDLLMELCDTQNMGLILITHDLGVVSQTTQKTAVMYAGRVVESGPTREIVDDPQHPYTRGLISALPQSAHSGKRLNQIPGTMPNLTSIPSGCSFHPRCTMAKPVCSRITPQLKSNPKKTGLVACHLFGQD